MDYSVLTYMPLFNEVDIETLEEIFDSLKVKEVEFEKGELLALQNEPVNRLIILTRGSIKAEMLTPAGKLVKVEDIDAPNPLAILFLFGTESNRFPVQVTALEKVSTLVMPRESVLNMLAMNRTILRNYLDISADFAAKLRSKLQIMSLGTIRRKMAMFLIQRSKTQASDTVELGMTKKAIAEYFGVSRPALEREITAMQDEGIIQSDRNHIKILNRKLLSELLS